MTMSKMAGAYGHVISVMIAVHSGYNYGFQVTFITPPCAGHGPHAVELKQRDHPEFKTS